MNDDSNTFLVMYEDKLAFVKSTPLECAHLDI